MSKYSIKSLKANLTPEELKAHKKGYWLGKMSNFTFSGMGAGRMCNTMVPLLKVFYKDKPAEDRTRAYVRQLDEFWNCEVAFGNLGIGILAAMEKDHAEGGQTQEAAISGVKAALIGPLSAIGDTIWTVLWRVICAGIALTFSLQGNILGPILYILLYNVPKFWFSWWAQLLGYDLGDQLITRLGESNMLKRLTKVCYVLGAFMVGAMVPMLVNVPLTLTFEMNGLVTNLKDIFNGIFPGLLELALLFSYYFLMTKKKRSAIQIVVITFIVGIVGALVHIF